MKKITFAASVLFVLSFSLQLAHAQAVLLHDDFEVSYDGWFANGDYAKITAQPKAGHNMSRGMKITNRHSSAEGAMSEKGFYLSGGEEYDYSVYVKHERPTTETYKLTLRWLYPDGVTYGSKVIASAAVSSGKWVPIAAKFTAPQSTVNLTLSITTNSTTDFFFDDVKVTQKQNGNQIKVLSKTLAEVGLKDIYAGYFRIGSVLNNSTINNSAIKALILKEFNSITMENEMKPDATMNATNSTNTNISVRLNNAASTLKFCSDNKIGVRGHTLVWHAQTPEWFFKDNFQNGGSWVTKAVMKQRLESYIKNLFALIKEQYPNLDLYAYDVVNEATSDNEQRTKNNGGAREPGYNDGKSPWVQVYGDNSFIEDAFTLARKYAPPTTKLFYNDYNEYWDHKRNSIIDKIIKPLRQKNVLDGMGMQSHINADNNVNAFAGINSYRTALNMYAELGEVHVSELDISTEGGKYTPAQQGHRYGEVFRNAIDKRSAVTAVVVWGPNDANSWVGTDKESGRSNAPLLFDKDNNRKPAWDTVARLVPESNWNGSSSSKASSSSISNAQSSSSSYNVTCNVTNLQASYVSGSNVPRPNVSCGTGVTVGTAFVFNLSGSSNALDGWNSNGNHAFWTPGTKSITLSEVTCGGNKVTLNPAKSCGSFEVVAASSSSAAGSFNVTCNVDNLQPSYVSGSEVPRPNVSCGTGATVGTASFSINGSVITGWASPNGTHALYNTGTRTAVLDSIVCNGNKVTIDPIGCGSFEIVAEPGSSSSSEGEDVSPILNNSQLSIFNSKLATYYTIKGEPLGNVKPQKAGVYIVKQGNSVRKIAVR
ncbi:MAG: endo-1,4-beta-xylanase [Fibromonadaceae bacterium]|jgi:GH35 family endo-1,4-beta-xylanase|nr:endo-1,4-beta-xylanase [Fibromonadaceae bacterium]